MVFSKTETDNICSTVGWDIDLVAAVETEASQYLRQAHLGGVVHYVLHGGRVRRPLMFASVNMENKLPSVYVETSIVSYLSARDSSSLLGAAHQLITRRWWERRNLYRCFISDVVIRECRVGDPTAALLRLDSVREFSSLAINDKTIEIAETLLALGIVPKKAAEDALHVAIAAAHGMDFLLTWNCRHIAIR